MPQPVLAAVIIAASHQPVRRRRAAPAVPRPPDRVRLAVACALGVVFIGVLQGIVIAVVLSVVYIFKRAWAPYSAVLGQATGASPATTTCDRYPDARAGARPAHRPLVGAAVLRQREPVPRPDPGLVQGIRDPPPRWVLVAAEPITDIDTTAGAMLADLDLELNAAGIHLAFAELQSAVRDTIVTLRPARDHRPGPSLPLDRRRPSRPSSARPARHSLVERPRAVDAPSAVPR